MGQHNFFDETCSVAVRHVDLMGVLLTWILLAQQYFLVQGQQEQLNFLDNNLVGSIRPKDLKSVLVGYEEATSTQKEKIFESIFKTLPRILVQFDGGGQVNHTSISMEILKMAGMINHKKMRNVPKNKNYTLEEPLEVWVSFSITADAKQIFNAATQANSMFSGTVTTILLHYKGQSLTTVTLPLIKEDIRKLAYSIKSHPQSTFTFGIILDLRNCLQQSDDIRTLTSYAVHVNVLLFKREEPDGSSSTSPPPLLQGEYENCRKKVSGKLNTTGTSIGFITPWPVSIEQNDDKILQMNLDNRNALNSYKSWTDSNNITLVLETTLRDKLETNKDKEKIREAVANIDVEWLRKPVVLSKQFFGVSIANSVLRSAEEIKTVKFISRMYEQTRKIIIGDVSEAIKQYQDKVQTFINYLAYFKRDIVRFKSGRGGEDIFEDQVPMRVYISMLISHEKMDATAAAINNAGDILIEGNRVYPDTITGIVLNCNSYPLEVDMLTHWNQFIVPNIALANQKVATNRLAEVGIILPIVICNHFSSVNETYQHLEKITVIIFRVDVAREEIKSGVAEQVDQLTKTFHQCKRNMELYFGRQQSEKKRVEFRVSPTGCDSPYSANSDIQSLSNLVRLWEEMNNFAGKEKCVITMDTAFDQASENEFCGWWKIIRDKRNDNVTFETKKATALKLYETLNSEIIKPGVEATTAINFWLMIILPTILFVLFLSATASYLVVRYRSRYIFGKGEANKFFKGMDDKDKIEEEPSLISMPKNAGNVTAHDQPYDKERLEVSKGSFTYDTKRSLGSGEFGIVCRGSIKKRTAGGDEKEFEIAVKMINDRQASSAQGYARALKGLLSEIKILSYVGKHKHIICLEGAYTSELRRGRVYVFLELCQMGSLDKHLRSFDPFDADEDNVVVTVQVHCGNNSSRGLHGEKDRYVNLNKKNILDDELARDLFQWSKEICCGMEYLASKNVVHADLATRNVLLDWKKCAKIADFGLSRRLYDYTNYVKKQQEPLPWRWMAPESLRRLQFNEKTDVWAFGVTLWELYNLGDQPYPGLSWKPNFVSQLERGLRLPEPRYKEGDMFKIMQSCWENDSACRPTFSELSTTLMGSKARYVNVNDIVPE